MNKKRKFQADQLGLPLAKLQCWDGSINLECGSPSHSNLNGEKHTCIVKENFDGRARDDGSEHNSANDSNSFLGYPDSVMSVSDEYKTDLQYPKTCSDDPPPMSSVNWGGICFKNTLYSLDSRSLTKTSGNEEKLQYMEEEHNSLHHNIGLDMCLNYEEHLLEIGKHGDFNFSEYRSDAVEKCTTDKELEGMLYSDGDNPNNYVLSSGRWNVNQETEPGIKKLTIDKEFEQYFSMLML